MLRAEYKDERWIITDSRTNRSREFVRLMGGIGYGDPAQSGDYALHAGAIAGRQDDDQLVVLEEILEPQIPELGAKLVDLKDRLQCFQWYCDPVYEQYRRQLRNVDGFCEYHDRGLDIRGERKYVFPPEHYPFFRDRSTAQVIAVPERILADWVAHCEMVAQAVSLEKIVWAKHCLRTATLHREGFKATEHPLMKAIVFAIIPFLREDEYARRSTSDLKRPASWYGNPQ